MQNINGLALETLLGEGENVCHIYLSSRPPPKYFILRVVKRLVLFGEGCGWAVSE